MFIISSAHFTVCVMCVPLVGVPGRGSTLCSGSLRVPGGPPGTGHGDTSYCAIRWQVSASKASSLHSTPSCEGKAAHDEFSLQLVLFWKAWTWHLIMKESIAPLALLVYWFEAKNTFIVSFHTYFPLTSPLHLHAIKQHKLNNNPPCYSPLPPPP